MLMRPWQGGIVVSDPHEHRSGALMFKAQVAAGGSVAVAAGTAP
jgi:hypothetical protein